MIRGSIFCEVRDPVELPLCEFYASAIRRLMQLFDLRAEVVIEHCRGVEAGPCRMAVVVQATWRRSLSASWLHSCARLCSVFKP